MQEKKQYVYFLFLCRATCHRLFFFAVNLSPFYDKKKTQTDSSLHEHNLSGKFSNTFTFYLLRKVNQGIPDSKLKFEYP